MKISPRSISLLLTACSVSMFVTGFSGAAFAQDKIVFKSLADFDKCAANNSYDTGFCMEALQKYAKAHPKELFAIGKRARLQFKHWAALQFFEPGLGTSPTAAQCADEDVSLAIVSGLSMPVDAAPNAIARRLLSGKCFASVRMRWRKKSRVQMVRDIYRNMRAQYLQKKVSSSVVASLKKR